MRFQLFIEVNNTVLFEIWKAVDIGKHVTIMFISHYGSYVLIFYNVNSFRHVLVLISKV